MTNHMLRFFIMSLILLNVVACGHGGGGGGGTPVYTTATVKIGLTGLPAGTAVIGAGFTLTLPADVTPALVSGATATGVVTPSGAFAGGTLLPPVYTAATASAPGAVKIALVNANLAGVTEVGEVVTVTLQLDKGAAPAAAAFTLDPVSVHVIDTSANPITGMQAVITDVLLQ